MKEIKINEYLLINVYTGTRRWLVNRPTKPKMNEIIVHVTGTVKYPDPVYLVDFGVLEVSELEAYAQAKMG